MKIVIIGYGEMGKIIERLAKIKDHEIVAIIDEEARDHSAETLAEQLQSADVAIDFSVARAIQRNVEACGIADTALVEGTTGWNSDVEQIRRLVADKNVSFVYGANFSIGVNLFYRIVDYASVIFSQFEEYEAFIEEQHHSRKVDAPSGTALKLKGIIAKHLDEDISVSSTRAGNIPGTHRVGFDGAADQILLEHLARSREGFAAGALLAAEWIVGKKKGFWEFTDVVDEILSASR